MARSSCCGKRVCADVFLRAYVCVDEEWTRRPVAKLTGELLCLALTLSMNATHPLRILM